MRIAARIFDLRQPGRFPRLPMRRWLLSGSRALLRSLIALRWHTVLPVVFISLLAGLGIAIMGLNAMFLAIGLILSVFILLDFRFGVGTLIILVPISALAWFPHEMIGIKGLNPLNLVLLATFAAYFIRRFFIATPYRLLPRDLGWMYILPLLCGALLGARHVPDIAPIMLASSEFNNAFGYFRDLLVKPMYFVMIALLISVAVAESRRIHWIFICALISIWVVAFSIVQFVIASGVSLAQLSSDANRSFFSPLGIHANTIGRLFGSALALLIFSAHAYRGTIWRGIIWLTAGLAGVVTLLTFSRGSFLILLIVGAIYIFSQRNKRMYIVGAFAALALLTALPGAVYNRIELGLDGSGNANTFTAGRTDEIWQPLLPEIATSPVVGHGLSSILWSDAMRSGAILPVDHPHNAYLELLLDLGLAGFVLIMAYFIGVWRKLRTLARDPTQDAVLRGLFAGALAAMAGAAVGNMAGSSFRPVTEDVYLWLVIGVMYGVLQRGRSAAATI